METLAAAVAAGRVVTQADFARLVGRHPSQVTRWIAAGKLGGAALVDRNGARLVAVREAVAQLQLSLDASQQAAQAVPLWASAPVAAPVAPPAGGDADLSASYAEIAEPLQRQLQEERLRSMRAKADRDEAENLLTLGQLVRVAEYNAALRRELGPLLLTFDELPLQLTEAVGKLLGDTSHAPALLILFRQVFVDVRTRWVAALTRSQLGSDGPPADDDVTAAPTAAAAP